MQISNSLKSAIDSSAKFARSLSSRTIESEHLFFGILLQENEKTVKLLNDYGVTSDSFKSIVISRNSNDSNEILDSISYSKQISDFFVSSSEICKDCGKKVLGVDQIMYLLILRNDFEAVKIIKNVCKLDMKNLTKRFEDFSDITIKSKDGSSSTTLPRVLENMGIDLTKKIRESDFQKVIGREKEIDKLIEILCRKTKNNPVLIGEPGVGKSSIIEGFAYKLISGNVPDILSGKIIYSLDVASIVSGTKYRGSMEQKLKDAIDSIRENKNIIVFVDELHTLVQAGSKDGEISPAEILKPYLARGELHFIGATTTKEYRDYIEKDPALERRFQPVSVEEPTEDDTIKILKGIKSSFENFHNVKILDEAIESAVLLSSRYITNRFLPDKAIDLIDEACSKVKVNSLSVPSEIISINKKINKLEKLKEECWKKEAYIDADKCKKTINNLKNRIEYIKKSQVEKNKNLVGEVNENVIREVISSWTKIPLQKITLSEKDKLLNLEKIIKNRVIGQDEAVSIVCNAIRRSRAGIGDPNKPIGSFLFLGPTGVGKTELSKALGDVLFDSENAIVRFDMSEFKEPHSISRLIGSPPGYMGHEEGGELTEAIRKNPYSIVLFDEIEKAHSDIYNILLQIFDDGRLTDSSGKLINFKNTIIIMTSNNGFFELQKIRKIEKNNKGKSKVDSQEFLMDKLRDKFKPELINRIDSIVIFNNLSKESVLKITNLMLNSVMKRLSERKISLVVTNSAKNLICDKGYDEEYGARPLRRVIDKEINDVIAEMIISGSLTENSSLKIDSDGVKFIFGVFK